jgi:hypothetical protein
MTDMSVTPHTPSSSHAEAVSAWQQAMALAHPVAIRHGLTLHTLLSGWLTRATSSGIAAAKLIPHGAHPQTWVELLQLQQAVLQQLQQQQKDWWQGWAAWTQEAAQLKRVNTMSKLVEQEFNLMAQLVLLLGEQTTNWVTLQENIEINYGYWVSEELGAKSNSLEVR